MNRFRFLPLGVPGWYGVFEQDGVTRHPGTVTTGLSPTGPERELTYQRTLPPAPGKRKEQVLVTLTAATVVELSQKIEAYFNEVTS